MAINWATHKQKFAQDATYELKYKAKRKLTQMKSICSKQQDNSARFDEYHRQWKQTYGHLFVEQPVINQPASILPTVNAFDRKPTITHHVMVEIDNTQALLGAISKDEMRRKRFQTMLTMFEENEGINRKTIALDSIISEFVSEFEYKVYARSINPKTNQMEVIGPFPHPGLVKNVMDGTIISYSRLIRIQKACEDIFTRLQSLNKHKKRKQ